MYQLDEEEKQVEQDGGAVTAGNSKNDYAAARRGFAPVGKGRDVAQFSLDFF